ncbi:DNA mismatch repair ATPase MutS [Pseudomonas syringae pv. actinidiae]|uniref:DNA mismatch repair ATPase MutS n=1 Tax=Pseudomonas syringae pv. actinidiae TaxID=103796 RepID=A0AAN4QCK5_PSESF|nr:DNA mismatch repair ATPase MutS [Pseudomonas syringae pv. actinidiae]
MAYALACDARKPIFYTGCKVLCINFLMALSFVCLVHRNRFYAPHDSLKTSLFCRRAGEHVYLLASMFDEEAFSGRR